MRTSEGILWWTMCFHIVQSHSFRYYIITMKKLLLVSVLASTLVLTGCTWTKKPTTGVIPQNTPVNQQDTIKKDDTMMWTDTTGTLSNEQMKTMENEAKMKKDAMVKDEMMKVEPASYIPYNELTAKSLLAAGKNVVLFFHAWRCPTCKSLNAELTAKLSTLPENSVVLKVDYDNSTDLKKKYWVTSQHTLVRVDKDMNLVSKQTGGDITAVAKLLK